MSSVLESLTRDGGVAGLNLIGGTALCPLARHFILRLVLVHRSTQEDPSQHD